LMLGFDLIQQF